MRAIQGRIARILELAKQIEAGIERQGLKPSEHLTIDGIRDAVDAGSLPAAALTLRLLPNDFEVVRSVRNRLQASPLRRVFFLL